MLDTREVNLTLDFCLRVGEVLLACGAGAADVVATMRALARHLGLGNPDIDVTFTSLSMGYQASPEDPPVVATRQVTQRAIDYEQLTKVDHLVRDVLRDDCDLRSARAEVARIVSSARSRPRWAITLGVGATGAGVAVQLGGNALVAALAFVSAACIDRLQLALSRRRFPFFYQQVVGGAVASLLALVATAAPIDVGVSEIVTANIIVMLAGIGFMGALQDALTGFYVTAGARLIEAILATAGIIAGVGGGLAIAELAGVHIPRFEPGQTNLQTFGLTILGAAIGAAAFAYSAYAPRRILLPIGLVAAAATAIFQSVALPGTGRTWSVAVAALFVGLVAFSVAGRMRVPPLVVVVSAVVPLLPGLSIYRALTLLGEGGPQTSAGLLSMFTAASVALALASGVILGEYVAQPLKREARKLESRLAGPRLVGPLRTETRRRRRRTSA